MSDELDGIDSDSGDIAGALVQYGMMGHCYIPTTSTTKTLPAGLYRLTVINDHWVLEPHKFITDDLLRLPDSKSDFVIDEASRFWPLKPEFKRLGYTHKRGFLLHGPPGSGKTSTVAFVLQQMVKQGDIAILGDVHPDILATMLARIRQVEPNRRMVVILEDLDALIKRYSDSSVLSTLDGENSVDNVIYIATTNYIEDLDKRITNRPSRFDRVVYIGMPNQAARKLYIEHVNEKSANPLTPDEVDYWAKMTEDFSVAHLKELYLTVRVFGHDFHENVERLLGMKKNLNSEQSPDKKATGFATPTSKGPVFMR